MASHEDAHSSLEVHHEPPIVTRSESPFPEEPVFVRAESPHVQISPSLPADSSFRDSATTKRFRDSEATKVEYSPGLYDEESGPTSRRPICGLQPITFWVLVALVFILCAGAIGGGVGGSYAVASHKNAAAGASSDSQGGANSGSRSASSLSARPKTVTEVTTTTSSTSWVSAAKPVPTANYETHGSSFKLVAHAVFKAQSESNLTLQCGDAGACQFRLDSSHLYGWYSDDSQYVDCHNSFVINAESVNQSCLGFDAGFSINGDSTHFYYGNSDLWWACPSRAGYWAAWKGDDCEEFNFWVVTTDLP